FFVIVLPRYLMYVAPRVGRSEFAGDRREARHHLRLFARLEEVGLSVGADVLQHLEFTEGAGTLGVRAPLRHALPGEARALLDRCDVVEQQRTIGPDTERMSVRLSRRTGLRRRCPLGIEVSHNIPSG